MGKASYLRAAWLYIIGIIFIIIGLYIFFAIGLLDTSMMPNAFYVMFFGFAISVFGGVYGRHVIKSPEFRESLQAEEEGGTDEEKREMEELEESIMGEKPKKKAPPKPPKPPQKTPKPPGQVAKPERVIKIIVCPRCGEENKYAAVFCDKCGNRLRPG